MIKSYKKQNVQINYEIYSSTSKLVEECGSRSITDSSFDNMKTKNIYHDFYGVDSYGEALELLDNGYQPSVDKIKEKIKVQLSGQKKRVAFNQSVVGFAPIVPLALQGVPNSMINSVTNVIKTKVIDVYYDMTANCSISAEDFLNAGQEMVSAIMELEMQGYRLNIFAVQSYSNNKKADMLIVKVKDAKQPLDLKRISFPLTHPAFFRVIGFDWYSKFPKGIHRMGYGHEISRDVDMGEHIVNMFGRGSVYFSAPLVINQLDKDKIKAILVKKK